MTTALVLSAGGMYAAWEIGVWKAISPHVKPDLIAGASGGAWNGWAIAGGATVEELEREWLDASLSAIRVLRPEPLRRKARELHERFRPQIPFGLTVVEAWGLRERLVRDGEITWRHLAATAAIPGAFPPVAIDGRFYMDGGLIQSLPLWAAEKMGATQVIALSCIGDLWASLLRTVIRRRLIQPSITVHVISPSERLGSVRESVTWSRANAERWMKLGERDGKNALQRLGRG